MVEDNDTGERITALWALLFIITPPMPMTLRSRSHLEILYLIPDNVKFITTNDQTIAQEILSRAKMP